MSTSTLVLHVEANSYEELLAKVDAALSGPVVPQHREVAPVADVEVPVNNEIITLKPGEELEPEVGRIYRHAQLIERNGKAVLIHKAPDTSALPKEPLPVAATTAIALAGESAPTEQVGVDTGAASLPAPAPHPAPSRPAKQAAAAQPSAEGAVTPASAAAPQATVDNGASAAPVAPPAVSVTAAPAATPVAAVPTLDDVRTALKGVTDHEKLGYPVAVKLLADFGYERISTLPEDKRGALIVECKNAVVRASVAA